MDREVEQLVEPHVLAHWTLAVVVAPVAHIRREMYREVALDHLDAPLQRQEPEHRVMIGAHLVCINEARVQMPRVRSALRHVEQTNARHARQSAVIPHGDLCPHGVHPIQLAELHKPNFSLRCAHTRVAAPMVDTHKVMCERVLAMVGDRSVVWEMGADVLVLSLAPGADDSHGAQPAAFGRECVVMSGQHAAFAKRHHVLER